MRAPPGAGSTDSTQDYWLNFAASTIQVFASVK
jgi:hypothetical protein